MVPASFLLHAGLYNLSINGVETEVRVVENNKEMKESYIDELNSRLDDIYPTVGFDLKQTSSDVILLVLYVKDYCLLVKIRRGIKSSPSLLEFLRDKDICFLGWGGQDKVEDKVIQIRRFYGHGELETCIGVETLAESVLRNKVMFTNLEELASKVGVTFPPVEFSETTANRILDGEEMFYTEEEIKYAVDEAYKCYIIGTKLLESRKS